MIGATDKRLEEEFLFIADVSDFDKLGELNIPVKFLLNIFISGINEQYLEVLLIRLVAPFIRKTKTFLRSN